MPRVTEPASGHHRDLSLTPKPMQAITWLRKWSQVPLIPRGAAGMGLRPHFPKLPGSRSAEGLTQPGPSSGSLARGTAVTEDAPTLGQLSPPLGSSSAPRPAHPTRVGPHHRCCRCWARSCSSAHRVAPVPESGRKQRGGAGQGGAEGRGGAFHNRDQIQIKSKADCCGDQVHRAPPPGPADPASDDSPASCTGAKFEQPGTGSARWPHLGPGAGSGRHLWDCLQDQVDGLTWGGMMHPF